MLGRSGVEKKKTKQNKQDQHTFKEWKQPILRDNKRDIEIQFQTQKK